MDFTLLTESGYLELFIGPMFSGKTSALIRVLTQLADIGYSVLLISHESDTRDSSCATVSSHASNFYKVSEKITGIKRKFIRDIHVDTYDVIGIDESQFFPDLMEVVKWVDLKHKMVFCSGLDGDFKRRPIGEILNLIPYSDRVEKMRAKCHYCTDNHRIKGSMNYRLIGDSPFTSRKGLSDQQFLIGGVESYVSLCRYHYLNGQNGSSGGQGGQP
jgi:thymidine kinase